MRSGALLAFLLASLGGSTMAAGPAPRQWRMSEFEFEAARAAPAPMAVLLSATFRGPAGESYDVPGFWDGGRTWRVRFAPPAPGRWTYRTRCEAHSGGAQRTLYKSGAMRGGEDARRVDIDISGAGTLELLVTDSGDGANWDHADWAEAELVRPGGEVVRLSGLEPESASQGHGELARDRNLAGKPLKIGTREFAHGLGTHAASRIVYKIEGRYERFRAWVGLDAIVEAHGTVAFEVRATVPVKATVPEGLGGRRGSFIAKPATGANPLFRHGGFLRASESRRYLTYIDGTPFFWLGDTWWFCPSKLVPFDGSTNPKIPSMCKALVDKRKRQGYTVAQMCFLGFLDGSGEIDKPLEWTDATAERWREADRYVACANDAGIIPAIGLTFHSGMDRAGLDDWRLTWRHAVARLGAYPVTWLVCGEYNASNPPDRVRKALALGAAIKGFDPYKRAMTIHPWWQGGERRQAWAEPWYDFVMFQGGHAGHGNVPPTRVYTEAWRNEPTRPLLEAECNYEGIYAGQPGREHTGDDVRRVAWHAVMAGSFGFTYGAQGLWYPTQGPDDAKFSDWGKPMVWWEALERPGAAQLAHLRACLESVEWWKLEPRPGAVSFSAQVADSTRPLVKSEGDRTHVVWFPKGSGAAAEAVLALAGTGTAAKAGGAARFAAEWFDPRTGRVQPLAKPLVASGGKLALPPRPDEEDWVLVLRRATDAR